LGKLLSAENFEHVWSNPQDYFVRGGMKYMDWVSAKVQILATVQVGTNLNTPSSHYRKVVQVDEQSGLRISIGKNATIPIPWPMLKACFDCLDSGSYYDGSYFRQHFPCEAKSHPCHVHVVGMLFVNANIAVRVDARRYRRAW
jgi:hypothetical protein